MIDPKELRIGNTVRYDRLMWTVQAISFDSLHLQRTHETGDNQVAIAPFEDIEPATLYVATLPLLGFTYSKERDNWPYEYIREGNERVFVVRVDEGNNLGLFCYVHDSITFDSVALCLLPSIHVLQNVFYYATGLELTLK